MVVDGGVDTETTVSVSRATNGSASLATVLLEQGGDDLDDLALLATREPAHLLERALDLTDGAGASGERRGCGGSGFTENVFDADAKHLGELGQDVGAGRLIGALPERDVGLSLTNELSELCLGERGGFSEREQAGPLSGPGTQLLRLSRHEQSVRRALHDLGGREPCGLSL